MQDLDEGEIIIRTKLKMGVPSIYVALVIHVNLLSVLIFMRRN